MVTRQVYELERWDLSRSDYASFGLFKSITGIAASWGLAGPLSRRFCQGCGTEHLVKGAAAVAVVAAGRGGAVAAIVHGRRGHRGQGPRGPVAPRLRVCDFPAKNCCGPGRDHCAARAFHGVVGACLRHGRRAGGARRRVERDRRRRADRRRLRVRRRSDGATPRLSWPRRSTARRSSPSSRCSRSKTTSRDEEGKLRVVKYNIGRLTRRAPRSSRPRARRPSRTVSPASETPPFSVKSSALSGSAHWVCAA